MRKILVSACLYGELCKYNALDNTCTDERFQKWKAEGRLLSVCPEVIGGLPVPRDPSERVGDRVLQKSGNDVTAEYIKGAEATVKIAKENDVICCIMKHRSPACGSSLIYDGKFSGKLIPGQGVATEYLRNAGFKVFSELELDEAEALIAQSDI